VTESKEINSVLPNGENYNANIQGASFVWGGCLYLVGKKLKNKLYISILNVVSFEN
jgi:hypothetical protein